MMPARPSVEDFLFDKKLNDDSNFPAKKKIEKKHKNADSDSDEHHESIAFLSQDELRKIQKLPQSSPRKKDQHLRGFLEEFHAGGGSFFDKDSKEPAAERFKPKQHNNRPDSTENSDARKVVRKSSRDENSVHKSRGSVEDIKKKTDDYLIEMREKASVVIQRWYRRTKIRNTAGAAAMKRMMANKKEELQARFTYERDQVFVKVF